MRVYHVCLTKEFDCTILAPSKESLEKALDNVEMDIDRDWDPPDWTWFIRDPLETIKKADKVPTSLPGADMVVLDDEIYSIDERGSLKSRIVQCQEQALAELEELRQTLQAAPVKPKPEPMDPEVLHTLQEEQKPWVLHNFGERPSWMPFFGLVEELGEREEALEAGFQPAVVEAKVRDAFADAMIFSADYCSAMGWELKEVWCAAAPFTHPDCKIPIGLMAALGRVAHAHLKAAQKIRLGEDHKAAGHQAMVYFIAHLIKMSTKHGFDLIAETHKVWQKVKQRDWKKDPVAAGEEP